MGVKEPLLGQERIDHLQSQSSTRQELKVSVQDRIPSIAKMALSNKPQPSNDNSLQNRSVVVNPKYDKWQSIPGPVISFFLNVIGFFGFIDQPKKGELVPTHILKQLSVEKLKEVNPDPDSFRALTDNDLRNLDAEKLHYIAPFLTQDQFKALSVDQHKQLLTSDLKELTFEHLMILKKSSNNFTPEENAEVESTLGALSKNYIDNLKNLHQLDPKNNQDVNRFFEWADEGILAKMPKEKASQIPKEFFNLLIIRNPSEDFIKKLGDNWDLLPDRAILSQTTSKLTQNPTLLLAFLKAASALNQDQVENFLNLNQVKGTLLETIKNISLKRLSDDQLTQLKSNETKNSYIQNSIQDEIERRAIQSLSAANLAKKLVNLLREGKGRFITETQMKALSANLELAKVVYSMEPQDLKLLGEHFERFDIKNFNPEIMPYLTDEQTHLIDLGEMPVNFFEKATLRQKAIIASNALSNNKFKDVKGYYLQAFLDEFEKNAANKKLNLESLKNALEGSSGQFREFLLTEVFNDKKYIIGQSEFPILVPYLKYLPADVPIVDLLKNNKDVAIDPKVQLLNDKQVAGLPAQLFNELSPAAIESLFTFNNGALTGEQIATIKYRDDQKQDQAKYVRDNLFRYYVKNSDTWMKQGVNSLAEVIDQGGLKAASDEQIRNIGLWHLLREEHIRKAGDQIAIVVNDPSKNLQAKMEFINRFLPHQFKALALDRMPIEIFQNLSSDQIRQLKPSDFSTNPLEKLRAIKDPTLLPRIITLKLTPEDWSTLKRTDGSLYSKLRRMHATFIRDITVHTNGKTGIDYSRLQMEWKSVEGRPYDMKKDKLMNLEIEDVKRFIGEKIPDKSLEMRILPARNQQYEGFTDGDVHYNPIKGGDVPHAYAEGNYSVAVNSSHLSTENSRGSDPIVDNMRFVSYKERGGEGEVFIMTGVDPAGNTQLAKTAGREAAKGCEHYIAEQLEQNGVSNTRQMSEVLLDSLGAASKSIAKGNEQAVCITAVVGKKSGDKTYCMAVGLGDMALRVIKADGSTVQNLTPGARTSSSDVSDPGGRLVNPGLDLRNAGIVYFELEPGDTLLMTSDGPEDKLDPEFNGLTVAQARDEAVAMNNNSQVKIYQGNQNKEWDDSAECLAIREAYKAEQLKKLNREAKNEGVNLSQAYVEDSYRRTEGRREIDYWLKKIDLKNPSPEEARFLQEAQNSKLGSSVTLPDGKVVVRGKDDDDSAQAYTITSI